MTTFKNVSKGSRGIAMLDGTHVFLDPNETKTIDGHKVGAIPDGIIEEDSLDAAPAADDFPPMPKNLQQLDHDGDGKPGGSKAKEPASLAGMTKKQLIAQAEKEGIIVDQIAGTGANGNVINVDIANAIEKKRAAA